MSYRISVVSCNRYLHLRVEGDNSVATNIAYVTEAHQMCLDRGMDAVLLEEHLSGPPLEIVEGYEVTTALIESLPASTPREAHVHADRQDSTLMGFVETVAANRGARMRSFETLDEAKAWLEA